MDGGAVPSPGKESRLIFPGWLPCGGIWQWDFVKPCPAIAGHPKGLGLGKIPQVDYTPTEPAGETPASSSRSPCFSVGLPRIASPRLSPERVSSLFVSGHRAVFPATGW